MEGDERCCEMRRETNGSSIDEVARLQICLSRCSRSASAVSVAFSLMTVEALSPKCIFHALYTNQKTKKAKTWHDGFVVFNEATKNATLYDEAANLLDKLRTKPDAVREGERLEFARYLVEVEQLKSDQTLPSKQTNGVKTEMREELPTTESIVCKKPIGRISRVSNVRPFKCPASIGKKEAKSLSDTDLLKLLDNVDEQNSGCIAESPFQQATKETVPSSGISFYISEACKKRSLVIPQSFDSFEAYKETFVGAIAELIQMHISKNINSKQHPVEIATIKKSNFKLKAGSNSPFIEEKFSIILKHRKAASCYSKDDLWVVGNEDLSSFFMGASAFHGPHSNGELELKIFKQFSQSAMLRSPRLNFKIKAVQCPDTSTELMLLTIFKESLTIDAELHNPLLTFSKKTPIPPLMMETGAFIDIQPQNLEFVTDFANRYHLNADQKNVFCAFVDAIFGVHCVSPFLLVHGVFGSGKSYLIAVLVIFVSEFCEQVLKKPPPKILISSITNVAVDRVLNSLLDLGFDDFLRIGSLKKISKSILPYSIQSLSKDDELKDLLEMSKAEKLSSSEAELLSRAISATKKRENAKVVKAANIVGSTCVATSFEVFDGLQFPIVILDEASQQIEPMSIAACRFGCRRLVLVGDPHQLPPTITFERSIDKTDALERTLFDRLAALEHPIQHLFIQYRCHPDICDIVNELFYSNQIITKYNQEANNIVNLQSPLRFVNVNSGEQQYDAVTGSLYNTAEAEAIKDLLSSAEFSSIAPEQIGIITFFRAQVEKIQSILGSDFPCQVATVDSFQGGEKKVILLSLVKTRTKQTSEAFMECPFRVNVALTRAKHALFLVGNKSYLMRTALWSKILRYFP